MSIKSQLNHLISSLKKKNQIFEQRQEQRNLKNFTQTIEIRKQINQRDLGKSIEAVIIDYSLRGLGLIIISQETPNLKDIYQFNTGQLNSDLKSGIDAELESIIAQVMWTKQIEKNLYRMGLKYITFSSPKDKVIYL